MKMFINLQKSSSQEPLGQFQPNLVGNMPGIIICYDLLHFITLEFL